MRPVQRRTAVAAACLSVMLLAAWWLGVPLRVIVGWYVLGHAACGR